MKRQTLCIYSLDRKIFEGEARSVSVPSVQGRIQILGNHVSLIAKLKEGDIIIETDEEEKNKETIPIAGGVLKVYNNSVKILVNF